MIIRVLAEVLEDVMVQDVMVGKVMAEEEGPVAVTMTTPAGITGSPGPARPERPAAVCCQLSVRFSSDAAPDAPHCDPASFLPPSDWPPAPREAARPQEIRAGQDSSEPAA